MSHGLLLPMAAHVLLVAALYVLLTIARAPVVWGIGRRPDGGNPWSDIEPRIGANLSNQFEWPLFFHVGCLVLLQFPPTREALVLAWIFIVGRLMHSAVQILVPDIRLRGAVFTINFLAVLGLWGLVVLAATGHPAG